MVTDIDISMVITTFNRGSLLRHSLQRLIGMDDLPAELLVIDDGGEDDTVFVCEEFAQYLPIRYIYNHNPGPSICSMARNIGLKEAQHDWIVTSEPELMYRTNILAQFAELHEEYRTQIISAGTVYFAPAEWSGADVGQLGHPEMVKAGDYTPPSGSQEAIGWVAPYTALWYRPWLMDLGGWDESFPGYWGWDDIDLLTRLRISGYGQHIALGCEAVHQFHGLGGDANFVNEEHFFKKSFTHGQEKHICHEDCPQVPEDLTDAIANKGKSWGLITPRS